MSLEVAQPELELVQVEQELEPVEDFLASRGIESLADRLVKDHDGKPVPLAEALAMCEPARASIDSTIETIRDMGGKDADILPQMTKHLERMGRKAQSTKLTPEKPEAEKK